jgi:hypothetical protein
VHQPDSTLDLSAGSGDSIYEDSRIDMDAYEPPLGPEPLPTNVTEGDPVLARLAELMDALNRNNIINSSPVQISDALYHRLEKNCTPFSGEFSDGNTFG